MKLTVQEILNKFSNNHTHAKEVQRLSLMIFDEACNIICPMPDIERKYLEISSLLHDIGYYIEKKNHNKHTMNMIIEDGISGFDDNEIKIIACICRYHRGSLPDKSEHNVYNRLTKKERKIVKRLGGILKLADGLEKLESVKTVTLKLEDNIVKIVLKVNNPTVDLTPAIKKRDLFEIGFKCQSIIKLEPNIL